MKPVSLIGYQMKNSSKEGDIISDPFIGSGTAMIAAHQAGRICYGMEIDPKYCQVVINRMKSYDPNIKIKRNGKDWEAEC
jgi:DNA modification methylase